MSNLRPTPRTGKPNKIGAQVKENILAVFTRLEGTAGMAKWARENRTEFYKIYARLLPTEVTATITRTADDLTDAELAAIAVAGSARASEPAQGEEEAGSVH